MHMETYIWSPLVFGHTSEYLNDTQAFSPLCCSGYAFLLFQEETSVQALIDACIEEDGKLYLCVSSPTIKDKPVSEPNMANCHFMKAASKRMVMKIARSKLLLRASI